MCGKRHTFAKQQVKSFAGMHELGPRDVAWVSGDEFRKIFPNESRGWNYDYAKLTPVVSGRTYAIGFVGGNARPVTRRVVFTETDKPTKCGAMCRNAKGMMCDCTCKGVNHGIGASFARNQEIDLTPTEEMASNAARGLELREKHGRGGTAVGVARARDIKNRKNLSPDTVRRMHSFFSRHEGNQAGGEDDAGYIAWLLWGGDAGKAWAKRKSAQLDKDENAMSETRKAIMERLGMAAHSGAKAAFSVSDAEAYERGVKMSQMAALIPNFREGVQANPWFQLGYQMGVKHGPKAGGMMSQAKREFPAVAARLNASRPGAKAKFAEDAREVAQEILRQLGGGRFMAMVGGKNAFHGTFGGKPGLQLDIGKGADGGINRLIVKLDRGSDTYDMEFWRIAKRGMDAKKVSEASNVYADDLQRIFTSRTKFYTSLSRPGAKSKFGITNAASAFLKKMLREYASMKGTRWYNEAQFILENPTEHTDADVIAAVGNLKLAKSVSSRPGAKAKMGKAADALNYIKNSIASGKTVYVTAGSRTTKVTPQTYAKWEASGRPLFKLGGDGALLMASGSSYVRLTMGDDMMLAGITAMSRPGAKAKMGFVGTAGQAGAMAARGMQDGAAAYRAGKPAVLNRLDPKYRNWSDKDLEVYGNFWMRGWTGEQMKDMTTRDPKRGTDLPGSRFSRPGAKAKFGYEKTVTNLLEEHGVDPSDFEFRNGDLILYNHHERGRVEQALRDGMQTGEIRSTPRIISSFSRPGAKAKFGITNSASAFLKKMLREYASMKGTRWYNEAQFILENPTEHTDADVIAAVGNLKLAKSVSSRSNAKAKFSDEGVAVTDAEYEALAANAANQKRLTALGSMADYVITANDRAIRERAKAALAAAKARNDAWHKMWEQASTASEKAEVERRAKESERGMKRWKQISRSGFSRPGAKVRNAADILKIEVMDGSTVTSSMTPSDFMAYAKRSLPGIGSTSFLPDMIARFNELAEEKGMRVRVRSNLGKSKNAIREGEKVSASDDAVSRKIRKLMDEGKPQDQAVAIALDLERRGEL